MVDRNDWLTSVVTLTANEPTLAHGALPQELLTQV